jgi:hypothetical protein
MQRDDQLEFAVVLIRDTAEYQTYLFQSTGGN